MIWLVGAGQMAIDYAKVLDALHCEYKVIGRGKVSAAAFKEKLGIDVHLGGIEMFLALSPQLPSSVIVSVGVDRLSDTTMALLNYGVESVLIEKPGGLELNDIMQLRLKAEQTGAKIFIAYNRRFFSSTRKVKELIEDEGGVTSFNFEVTEWSHVIAGSDNSETVLSKWFLANSTHVADMAFFLGGKPDDICCFTAGKLDWHPSASVLSGAGRAVNGALFNYAANWESAGRWSVEVLTRENRYILRPMESLFVQKKGTISQILVEIDDDIDRQFKPGLYKQVEAFLSSDTRSLCSIDEQLAMFEIYETMANY